MSSVSWNWIFCLLALSSVNKGPSFIGFTWLQSFFGEDPFKVAISPSLETFPMPKYLRFPPTKASTLRCPKTNRRQQRNQKIASLLILLVAGTHHWLISFLINIILHQSWDVLNTFFCSFWLLQYGANHHQLLWGPISLTFIKSRNIER